MLGELEEDVRQRFDEQDREHAGFPWMYSNHIRIVKDEAEDLLEVYDADEKVVMLGAVLHDVGYLKDHKNHESVGYEKAKEILEEHGVELSEKQLELLKEAISEHGYKGQPESIEAKIIASADALAHLNPKFWITNSKVKENTISEFYEWMENKIQKDLNKICLEKAEKEAESRIEAYNQLKIGLSFR